MARASDIFLKRDRAKNAKAWMPVRGGVKFLILSSMNEAYQKAVSAPGHDDDDEYYTKLVAKHLILDWQGLDNDEGTAPLECTEETKLKLLRDYTEIGSLVISFASVPSNFIEANYIEEELGNS